MLVDADPLAKIGGVVWLAIGGLVFLVNVLRGHRPTLTIREDAPVEERATR